MLKAFNRQIDSTLIAFFWSKFFFFFGGGGVKAIPWTACCCQKESLAEWTPEIGLICAYGWRNNVSQKNAANRTKLISLKMQFGKPLHKQQDVATQLNKHTDQNTVSSW